MTEKKDVPTAVRARSATRSAKEDAADAERRMARLAAMGIPSAAVVGAIGTGLILGLGPAILVLAAGTLLGTIALLWASLRTLSGDAPLPTDLESLAVRSRKVDSLAEQKRRVLRGLKDLEFEHSVGKIDDKDYASLGERFRNDAKAILREMDQKLDPFREEAERIAQKHLEKAGLGETAVAADEEDDVSPAPASEPDLRDESRDDIDDNDDADESARELPKVAEKPERVACPKCSVSNEPDAAFCKKCGTALAPEESHA